MFKPFTFLTFVLLLLLANSAHAQKGPKNTISASRCEEAIKIDGVFDEPSWQNATMVSNFVQNFPDAGAPSAFDTRVRVLYTSFGLYVAAEMNTPAGGISDQINERDNLNFTDYFELFLDGFHDGTQGYTFAVSVAGVQSDSKYESIDFSSTYWNAVWNVSTRKTENGWVAEMEIPYGAIRFSGNKPAQIWNINFKRFHFKSNETSYWNPVNPALPGITNQTGELVGVMNPHTRGRLQVNSGLNSSAKVSRSAIGREDNNLDMSTSLDLKIGLSDAFTLDLRPIPTFFHSMSTLSNVTTRSSILFSRNNNNIWESNYYEGNDIFKHDGANSPLINENRSQYDTIRLFNLSGVRIENYHTSKLSGRTPGKTGIGVYNSVYAPYTQTVFDSVPREIRYTNTLVNVIAIDQTLRNNSKVFIDNSIVKNGRSSFIYTMGGATLRDKYNKWAVNVEGSSAQNLSVDSTSALYNYGIGLNRTAGNFTGGFSYKTRQGDPTLSQASDIVRWSKNDIGFNVGYRTFKPWKNWNSIQALLDYRQSIYENGDKNSLAIGNINLLNRKFQSYSIITSIVYPIDQRSYVDYFTKEIYQIRQSPTRNIGVSYSSDFRKKLSFNTSFSYMRSHDRSTSSIYGRIGFSWRPNSKASFNFDYSQYRRRDLSQVFSLDAITGLPDSNFILGSAINNDQSLRLTGIFAITNVLSMRYLLGATYSNENNKAFYDINSEGQLSPSAYTGRNADNVSFHDYKRFTFGFSVNINYRFYHGSDLFVNLGNLNYNYSYNYSQNLKDAGTFVSSTMGGSLGIRCQLDYAFLKHQRR